MLPLKVVNCISGPPPLMVPLVPRSNRTKRPPFVRLYSTCGGWDAASGLISKSVKMSP